MVWYSLGNPAVFTINITSPPNTERELVCRGAKLIPSQINLEKFLKTTNSENNFTISGNFDFYMWTTINPNYAQWGAVAYYGKHYIAFYQSDALKCWLKFDDSKVEKVGNSWEDVVEFCNQGAWMLTVLFYLRAKTARFPKRRNQNPVSECSI